MKKDTIYISNKGEERGNDHGRHHQLIFRTSKKHRSDFMNESSDQFFSDARPNPGGPELLLSSNMPRTQSPQEGPLFELRNALSISR